MRTRTALIPLAAAVALSGAAAFAAEGEQKITDVSFPYEGPFGTFDEMQLQRGFQVYHQVCASCHGLEYLAFRTLGDESGPNFPEEQVDGIAALYTVTDQETGEDRPAEATDYFPQSSYQGAPDLTLMTKARAGFHGPYGLGISQLINGMGGDEYLYSLLTHYTGETKEEAGTTLYENTAFPGNWISMPPPLSDDLVDYGAFGPQGSPVGGEGEGEGEGEDGHAVEYTPPPATVEQMAKDVSAFLMWTAEPRMIERKEAGFRNVIVLIILAVLLYYTNKKLWRNVKGTKD